MSIRYPVRCLALWIGLVLWGSSPVDAAEIEIRSIRRLEDGLEVDLYGEGFVTSQGLDLLHRGFTTIVQYTVELWRVRSSWFDDLSARQQMVCTIVFDLMEGRYHVTRYVGEILRDQQISDDIEELSVWISKGRRLRLRVDTPLRSDQAYYIVARGESRAVTSDDLRDVRRWLEGMKAEEEGEGSWVLRMLLRLAGGTLAARHRQKASFHSDPFLPADLPSFAEDPSRSYNSP